MQGQTVTFTEVVQLRTHKKTDTETIKFEPSQSPVVLALRTVVPGTMTTPAYFAALSLCA